MSPDCVVGAFGDVRHGQAEIEAAYDKLLHYTMPGAKVKQERGSVRMLSLELAVWQGGIEIIPLYVVFNSRAASGLVGMLSVCRQRSG